MTEKGLIIVYTGDGKGKTSAALGAALRAVGYGYRVCIIQFMKGSWYTGEIDSIRRLTPDAEFHRAGAGFYKILDDTLPEETHLKAAKEGMSLARKKAEDPSLFLLILDEINVALREGLLEEQEVLRFLQEKPRALHVILTGRNALESIIQMADLVTEMTELKHPFEQGMQAVEGIDF